MNSNKKFDDLSEKTQKYLTDIALKHCEPLYLSAPHLNDAHTKEKQNATITYVKYNNTIYGITCGHAFDSQFKKNELIKVLSIWGRNNACEFGKYNCSKRGYKSNFRSLYDKTETSLDIAIVELEEKHCEHMKQKGKQAINLDSWEKPDLENIRTCVVSGFPTESKKETPNYLSAPLPLIIAEAQSGIIESRNSFVLASHVSENNFFFSGVSGGPVFYIMRDDSKESYGLGVIGIVYEGSPGSSSAWVNRGKESFYTRNDILFNVYILTPEIFSCWLKRLDYI